jgi:hypothetical protein
MLPVISVWITGNSGREITHVINGTGNVVNRSNKKATVDLGQSPTSPFFALASAGFGE